MGPPSLSPCLPVSTQDEREARETVKREQDEAYRLSLEADRKKVFSKLNWLCTPSHFSGCNTECSKGNCIIKNPGLVFYVLLC